MVWDAFRARNFDAFASYLADNFIEIEPDGIFDKPTAVKGVQTFDFSKTDLSGWKTVKIDDDASIVTYVINTPGMGKAYHSSVWASRNGKWLGLFHQERLNLRSAKRSSLI